VSCPKTEKPPCSKPAVKPHYPTDSNPFIFSDDNHLVFTYNLQVRIRFGNLKFMLETTVMRHALIAVCVLIVFQSVALSAVIEVPKDYSTIQAAIDASVNGDTVLVAPGTYTENIDFKGKKITLKSTKGPGLTTIDGNETGSVITFNSGEDLSSVLDGFTITNGSGTYIKWKTHNGGGIYCADFSSPTIINNLIIENSVDYRGGGISCMFNSNPSIIDNTISANYATYGGGGIYCSDKAAPIIDNCEISQNSTHGALSGSGGGINCSYSSPIIMNCTISKNSAFISGGGIYCGAISKPQIINNKILQNTSHYGGGINCYYYSSPVINNNIISENKGLSPSGAMGGGIYCAEYSSPSISNNYIIKNTVSGLSENRGGGLFFSDDSPAILVNN